MRNLFKILSILLVLLFSANTVFARTTAGHTGVGVRRISPMNVYHRGAAIDTSTCTPLNPDPCNETECAINGFVWSYTLGKCVSKQDICLSNSFGTWNGTTCICKTGYKLENDICVIDDGSNTDKALCEKTNGTWNPLVTPSCICPTGTTLTNGLCIPNGANPDILLCTNSSGTWDATNLTCICPTGKTLQNKICIDNNYVNDCETAYDLEVRNQQTEYDLLTQLIAVSDVPSLRVQVSKARSSANTYKYTAIGTGVTAAAGTGFLIDSLVRNSNLKNCLCSGNAYRVKNYNKCSNLLQSAEIWPAGTSAAGGWKTPPTMIDGNPLTAESMKALCQSRGGEHNTSNTPQSTTQTSQTGNAEVTATTSPESK